MPRLPRFGPGLLVTAAFIGPGTLTTATRAGASFGLALLWAVAFAVLATVVLQEMSARLGLVTRQGLGEALRSTFRRPLPRALAVVLVIGAITFGNAAFQFGNITGASVGLRALTGWGVWANALLIGGTAFVCLALGRYRLLERLLVALVVLMSLVFLLTAVLSRPDPSELGRGLFVPALPPGSLLTVMALIGTTVVPYNLFLHASAVREKWPASAPVERSLTESRADTVSAVLLGGLITGAIVATAAAAFFAQGKSAPELEGMAGQLEATLGPAAQGFFALGLFAAGLTSAITAPLAAAYATAGALGWRADLRAWKFRMVWLAVLVTGTALACVGYRPTEGIILAQAFNGVLLPVVAVFLLVAVNRRDLMGEHRNGWRSNLLGGSVVLVAAGLGVVQVLRAAGAV
ncbi:MAG TPA: Nramp family divalent metal transporter [Gemmataceae bacterium]